MTGDEQVILKAACVQAAATLVAVWWPLFRPNIQVSQQELEGHACTFEPADGAKGPAWVTLIRREAEVNLNDIILPSDNDNPVSAAVSGLAAIGIICRV